MDHPTDDPKLPRAVGFDERPDLLEPWLAMPHEWPPFMAHTHPPAVDVHQVRAMFADLKRFWIDASGRVVAHIYAVRLAWAGTVEDLPSSWNAIVERAVQDRERGVPVNTACALGAEVRAGYRGRGMGARMLADLKRAAAGPGIEHFLAPVRPTGKARAPELDTQTYVGRRRADDLPVDGWLRCHVRGGARVLGVLPRAVTVTGTAEQWASWTGQRFVGPGPICVAGGLHPVHREPRTETWRYDEDAVWAYQRLDRVA